MYEHANYRNDPDNYYPDGSPVRWEHRQLRPRIRREDGFEWFDAKTHGNPNVPTVYRLVHEEGDKGYVLSDLRIFKDVVEALNAAYSCPRIRIQRGLKYSYAGGDFDYRVWTW